MTAETARRVAIAVLAGLAALLQPLHALASESVGPERFGPWRERATGPARSQVLEQWKLLPHSALGASSGWRAIDTPLEGSLRSASGRVSGLLRAFDATQDVSVLWLGSSSGGLFKQRAADLHWIPVSDSLLASPAVGAFAIAGDGRILIATGDPWRSSGDGVFFSDDEGASWIAASMPQIPASIYRLRLDAVLAQRVWIATPIGLMRSDDAGASFVLRSGGHFTEIVQDPLLPSRWYAASQNAGILRSDDGGESFIVDNPPGWQGLGGIGRVSIAASASEAGLVFALVCDNGQVTRVLRRRSSMGWSDIHADPQFGWGQSFHACAIAVNPADGGTVAVGAGGVQISHDALAANPTWTDFSSGHSDTTTFFWDGPDTLLAGNDGGLYRIDPDTLAIDDSENRRGLSLSQVFGTGALALARGTAGVASAAYQDNGIARVSLEPTPLITIAGEVDGAQLTVSPRDDNRVAAVIGLPFSRYWSFDGGAHFGLMQCPAGAHAGVSLPLLWDPAPDEDPSVRLYFTRGNAGATSISRMNPSLTCSVAVQSLSLTGSANFRADFLEIAHDPTQLRAYVSDSASNGEIRFARVHSAPGSRNGSMSFEWIDPPEPRAGRVMVDPHRPDRILWWANGGSGPAALWVNDARGDDGAWRNLSGNLPVIGAALRIHRPASHPADAGRFWVATNFGVLTTRDGLSWSIDGEGLPAVVDATELQSERVDGSPPLHRLWLGTYGRGLWLREESIDDLLFADGFETP